MNREQHTQAVSSHGLGLILIAAILWGTVGITTRALYGLSHTGPLSIGFYRLALATPALLIASWRILGVRLVRLRWRDLGVMSLIGVMLAAYQVAYFAAIAQVGVSVSVLVTLCTAPIIVALLTPLVSRERLTRTIGLALVCALTGTALLINVEPGAVGQNPALGVLLALGSAFGYAVITLAGRAVAGRYHSIQITTIGFAVGALALLPAALASGLTVSYPPLGWGMLLYLGLIPSALAYILFMTGIRSTPATVASIVTLIEPLTSTVLAMLLFGERLGAWGALGAALLLTAMALLYRRG